MSFDPTPIVIAISAAIFSGLGTALIAHSRETKKEKTRQLERYQDQLKMDLKDLKIQLYQLERDLIEWKDKYYAAIEELVIVKSELEQTLVKLTVIEAEIENFHGK